MGKTIECATLSDIGAAYLAVVDATGYQEKLWQHNLDIGEAIVRAAKARGVTDLIGHHESEKHGKRMERQNRAALAAIEAAKDRLAAVMLFRPPSWHGDAPPSPLLLTTEEE